MLKRNIYRGWRSINIITEKNNHSNLLCPSSSQSGAGSYLRRSNAHAPIPCIYYIDTGNKFATLFIFRTGTRRTEQESGEQNSNQTSKTGVRRTEQQPGKQNRSQENRTGIRRTKQEPRLGEQIRKRRTEYNT